MSKRPRKPQTYVTRTEFFEDTHEDIGGPYQTDNPAHMRAFLEILDSDTLWKEEGNNRVIDGYEERGRRETKNLDESETLLQRCESLRRHIGKADIHGAVYDALLMQEAYVRLILKAREPDARMGRERKLRSQETIRKNNQERTAESEKRASKIAEDSRRLRRQGHSSDVAGILAKKYDVDETTIRRAERKAGIR